MSGWVALGMLAISASWKWLLLIVVIAGVTVGALFAAGVFTGGGDKLSPTPPRVAGPTPTVTVPPTKIPTLAATRVPRPAATQSPTLAPPPGPRPTASPAPTPTPAQFQEATPTPAPTAVPGVEVLIYAQGARNLGSLQFVLGYEPTVLAATKVARGTIARDAILEFTANVPGRVWAGIVDANGMTGDGPVAVISFDVVGHGEASTALTLAEVMAYDANTLVDIITRTSEGIFQVSDRSFISPTLSFSR